MNYEVRDIVTPIVDFIKTCPFADEFKVDIDNLGVQRIDGTSFEGSAVDYVGSNQISDAGDIINDYSVRQANFNVWLLRKSDKNFYREEIANFLFNFEQWIEYCQINNLTPKLSNDEEDFKYEIMFADNGALVYDTDNEQSSVYVIQLHVIYTNRY